jgi:release factor glutamine methyltransferase
MAATPGCNLRTHFFFFLLHLFASLFPDELWDKRVYERVPLQYLTSSAYWENLLLSVGQGVLIPRPETELIIDFVVDAVAKRPHLAKGQWADLGTGSGALAIGVARALPTAPIIWAVDVAPTPLAYASYNARRAGVEHRVKPVQGSWYEPILAVAGASTQLAGIVSNPPYIASEELPALQAEVGRHEPWLALDGGEGLAVDSLIPICTGALHTLQPGGFIALETGGGEQAAYTAHVLRHMREEVEQGHEVSAFEEVIVRRDLRGIERFVTATRRERA